MRKVTEYTKLVATATILPEWKDRIESQRRKLMILRERYDGFNVPWQFLAVLHMRESGNDFSRQLLNGERWDQKTKFVPVGLGPFKSWKDSTIEACKRFANCSMNTTEEILYQFERWNGFGYASRGLQSPYLWTGSNHGVGLGKFTADSQYDPAAQDKQLGAAVMYLQLIRNQPHSGLTTDFVRDLQALLVRAGQPIKVDGILGAQTRTAIITVLGDYL